MTRILLIDDEGISVNDTVFYLEHYLPSTKIQITNARSCSDAVALFKQNFFDLIILDLSLPIGDYEIARGIIEENQSSLFGLQLLNFFRKENKAIRIIVFSIAAYDAMQLHNSPNTHFLTKTMDNAYIDLVNLVKSQVI
jgi:CheY-like chemotaxis protein